MHKELWICPFADVCEPKLPNFKHCIPHTKNMGCEVSGCRHPGEAYCVPYKQEPDWEV